MCGTILGGAGTPPILNVGNSTKEVPLLIKTVAGLYGLEMLDCCA